MTVDLSTSVLSSVAQTCLIIGPDVDTPWKDSLKVQEAKLAADGISKSEARYHAVLKLPSSIRRGGRKIGKGQILEASGASATVDKETLIPSWRKTSDVLVAELNPMLLAEAVNDIPLPARVSFVYANLRDPQIQHIMLALRAELEEGCPGGRLFGESLATTLAVHVMRRYAVFSGTLADYRRGLPARRLRAVVDYIQKHLGDKVSLRQLADIAEMSQFHFGHLFKQSTGLSPYQFVVRQRIAKAKDLLVDSNLPLAHISYTLGFASQTHFTTVFRELEGTTPLAYRNAR